MAQKYRRIDPRLWSDERFVKLGESEKLVAVYCLTSSQVNRIGLFRFSAALGCEETDTPLVKFQRRFDTVCRTLRWRFDLTPKVLYFPTWWKYNAPANAKAMIGYLKDLHDVPESKLVKEFLENTRYLPDTVSASLESYRIQYGMPYQEREREREIEGEIEQDFDSPNGESCTEPQAASVLAFPCNGPEKLWNLTEAKVAEYRSVYPSLDILAECKRALQWLRDNPDRRKTAKGMPRFLGLWIGKANDRGGSPTINGRREERRSIDIDNIDLGPGP